MESIIPTVAYNHSQSPGFFHLLWLASCGTAVTCNGALSFEGLSDYISRTKYISSERMP